MSKSDKLIAKILSGRSDSAIRFAELVALLAAMGFQERIKGSHHIFYRHGIEEILNLQPVASQAKPYQVKQIRNIILKYRLEAYGE